MTTQITLSPLAGDNYPQIMAALAQASPNGLELTLKPGFYALSQGIVEAVPGLFVRGLGHRIQGPGNTGMTTGVVLSCPAGWAWTRSAPLAGSNEYRGARMEGLTFAGGANGAGGLLIQSCYNTIRDCLAVGYTVPGARGFYVLSPSWAGGSAQENFLIDCGATNCSTGFESTSNDGTELRGFITLKNTSGGIHGTGYGAVINDNNSRVIGGKVEGNSTGLLVRSVPGITITGMLAEDNAGFDCDLDKGTTSQSWTSNVVCAAFGKVRVGPYNFGDTIVGIRYPRTFLDVPNPEGIRKSTTLVGALA